MLAKSATRSTQKAKKPMTKIMVIDDEPLIVVQLSTLLAAHGYETVPATGTLEAMGLLRTREPRLVILDLNMPRLDGFEFLKSLRESARWKSMKVIVLSALSDPKSRFRAKELGVVKYLVKPYTSEDLLSLIRKLT